MPKFFRMLLIVGAVAQASLGLSASSAHAQSAGKPIPPPLSFEQARYYKAHPSELAALMSKMPVPHDNVGPVADPPQLRPIVGGTWTSVTARMPAGGSSAPHLMMDGTVLVHSFCTGTWNKLTPSATGSYAAGTWSTIAPMPAGYTPLYFASQVLVDGRLIMNGGEYNAGCGDAWTNLGAIYNPATNTWKSVVTPFNTSTIGDAQSVVLFNKDYMLADCCSTEEAILNPSTMTWALTGSGKFDENDEEAWSLLPTGNIITGDGYVNSGACGMGTQRYTASTGKWANAPNSPVQLSDCDASYEVGPEVLRPNGTVVLFSGLANGSPAGTAVYNVATNTYVKGANVPAVGAKNYTLADAPAALLPNGNILFAASPGPAFATPTHFFEYTLTNTAAKITNDPPDAGDGSSYIFNMLVLPTGQVMLTDFSSAILLYNPAGAPEAAWAPVITTLSSSTIKRGTTYTITGKQLNGLSEAGAYGDDNQAATDFPLVRISDSAKHTYYCKTTNETSRDIAVNAVTTMDFVCPTTIATGTASLVVVTNGIPSAAKTVKIQ